MPKTLLEYAQSLDDRKLIWPAPPKRIPVDVTPDTEPLADVRGIALCVYGTLLRISQGKLLVEHPLDMRMEIALEKTASGNLVTDLSRKLSQWTNRRWIVVVSTEPGEPTIKAQNEARQAELRIGVRADPLVQAVLARFPGAEIVSVRERSEAAQVGQDEAITGEHVDETIPGPPPVDDGSRYEADWRPEDYDDVI